MDLSAKTVELDDLAAGEDFGVRFSDPDANWSGATPTLVLVPPGGGAELTPGGTTSVDGTEFTVTVIGSTTQGWALGRWKYSFWILNGGGSRQYLATGGFRVFDAVGVTP